MTVGRPFTVTSWIGVFVSIALFLAAGGSPGEAADAQAYFKGKTIKLVCSQKPGGGTEKAGKLQAVSS